MIKKPNLIIISLICLFVIIEILFLRPSTVEVGEDSTTNIYNSIETMVQSEKYKDETGYTIDGFHYTAVEGEIKHWELTAKQAILYEKSRHVAAHQSIIKMFDDAGKITEIHGDQAAYQMGSKDLELVGNVTVLFADGFRLETTKAHYSGTSGVISSAEKFHGISAESRAAPKAGPAGAAEKQSAVSKGNEQMEVWGRGFSANRLGPLIHIENSAHVRVTRPDSDEVTDVRSDHVKIDRAQKVAYFSMANTNRYVESKRGTLQVRSRRQEVVYNSAAATLRSMMAVEDVLIVETAPKKGIKYATSQKAEFLAEDDRILLSGFPSVYQDHDILNGEPMIIDRKRGLVEVINANALHDGR